MKTFPNDKCLVFDVYNAFKHPIEHCNMFGLTNSRFSEFIAAAKTLILRLPTKARETFRLNSVAESITYWRQFVCTSRCTKIQACEIYGYDKRCLVLQDGKQGQLVNSGKA